MREGLERNKGEQVQVVVVLKAVQPCSGELATSSDTNNYYYIHHHNNDDLLPRVFLILSAFFLQQFPRDMGILYQSSSNHI